MNECVYSPLAGSNIKKEDEMGSIFSDDWRRRLPWGLAAKETSTRKSWAALLGAIALPFFGFFGHAQASELDKLNAYRVQITNYLNANKGHVSAAQMESARANLDQVAAGLGNPQAVDAARSANFELIYGHQATVASQNIPTAQSGAQGNGSVPATDTVKTGTYTFKDANGAEHYIQAALNKNGLSVKAYYVKRGLFNVVSGYDSYNLDPAATAVISRILNQEQANNVTRELSSADFAKAQTAAAPTYASGPVIGAGGDDVMAQCVPGLMAAITPYGISPGQARDMAIAIAGNLKIESGCQAHPGGSKKYSGAGQWDAPRAALFRRMMGRDLNDRSVTIEDNYAYIAYELFAGKYQFVGQDLRQARTVGEMARIIAKEYEVGNGVELRVQEAENYAASIGSPTSLQVAALPVQPAAQPLVQHAALTPATVTDAVYDVSPRAPVFTASYQSNVQLVASTPAPALAPATSSDNYVPTSAADALNHTQKLSLSQASAAAAKAAALKQWPPKVIFAQPAPASQAVPANTTANLTTSTPASALSAVTAPAGSPKLLFTDDYGVRFYDAKVASAIKIGKLEDLNNVVRQLNPAADNEWIASRAGNILFGTLYAPDVQNANYGVDVDSDSIRTAYAKGVAQITLDEAGKTAEQGLAAVQQSPADYPANTATVLKQMIQDQGVAASAPSHSNPLTPLVVAGGFLIPRRQKTQNKVSVTAAWQPLTASGDLSNALGLAFGDGKLAQHLTEDTIAGTVGRGRHISMDTMDGDLVVQLSGGRLSLRISQLENGAFAVRARGMGLGRQIVEANLDKNGKISLTAAATETTGRRPMPTEAKLVAVLERALRQTATTLEAAPEPKQSLAILAPWRPAAASNNIVSAPAALAA